MISESEEENAVRLPNDEAEYSSPISGFGEQPDDAGKVHYGGQAVIEGVMMRGPEKVATAVRLPDGTIAVQTEDFTPATRRHRMLRLPIVRGGVTLIESLALGIKALNYSASMAIEEAEVAGTTGTADGVDPDADSSIVRAEPEAAPAAGEEPRESGGGRTDVVVTAGGSSDESNWKTRATLTGTMIFAFALGILFFFYIPLVLSHQLTRVMGSESSIVFNLIDGVIRMAFFLAYIWGISQWKEMRRVFEYHGAEHKTIFAQEAGEELTPANARKYTTRHPRCGTSFLLIVMLVSILVFILTGKPQSISHRLLRLLLIPVIAGISYEIMKLSAKKSAQRWARIISAPGVWLQRITTKEPSDDQLEVAIAAIKAVKLETDDAR